MARTGLQGSEDVVPIYQLHRLGDDGCRMSGVAVDGNSDGDAVANAMLQTESGAHYLLCQGDRAVATFEVNDNRFLFRNDHRLLPERPLAIRFFEVLFLATLALGALQALIEWSVPARQLARGVPGSFPIAAILGYCLVAALCLLVSRRRSLRAIFSLVAIYGVGGVMTLRDLLIGEADGIELISVAIFAVEALALYLPFTRAAWRWMWFDTDDGMVHGAAAAGRSIPAVRGRPGSHGRGDVSPAA